MMANFFIKFLMFSGIFNTVSLLPISDFFPFGTTTSDVVIIDKENNTRLLRQDDAVLPITTPHIPFFNRTNNINVQISTNGYVAFGKTIYNRFVSLDFPFTGVAMIAPFWTDLEFIKTSAKFYYQIHTEGRVLVKASQEILRKKGVSFQPNFVLVVTWFKTNIYQNSAATVTVQLALACDATETFIFFLYNQLENLSKITSVGWNDGNSTQANFFKHPLHRMANVSKLVTTSNVGVNGEWIYRIGKPGGIFPRIRRKPTMEVTAQNNRLVFNCSLSKDVLDPRGVYEITWYNGDKKINKTDILQNGSRTSLLMNENMFQSLYQLGVEISCKVRTWYTNTSNIKSPFHESNVYFAGIKVEPRQVVVTEGSEAAKVNVTNTVPIVCNNGSTNCEVTISFPYQRSDILLSTCMLSFKPNSSSMQELVIHPIQDFIDDGQTTVTITPVVNQSVNMFDWLNYSPSPPIIVTTTNVATALCSSSGDPYISTFDNTWYAFFNIGDFVLAQSVKNNFKIHIRTFDCLQGVTCNCAVAAQEKDDIVAIDMCNSVAPKFRFPTEHPPSPGTTLKEINPSKFQIEFPSGASITFQVHRRSSRLSFANIYVQIPSIYHQKTEGLCGIFDGNRFNDMTSKEGTVYQQTNPARSIFVNSWKLRNRSSLFFTRSENKSCKRLVQYNTTSVCSCILTGGVVSRRCGIETFAVRPTFASAINFKTIFPAAFAHCSNQSLSNTIIVPDEDDKTIYEYDPPDQNFVPKTWPTPTGKTQAQVEAFCDNAILNSTSGQACSLTLGDSFGIATFRRECISDILISDSYDYIQSIIDAMTTSCTEIVLRGINEYWDMDNNGTLTPPATIANSICPNDCNGKGQCVNSTCSCNVGFEGADCSVNKNTPLSVVSSVELCDGRTKRCLTVSIEGSNIKPSSPVFCIFTPKVPGNISFTTQAVVVSFAEVLCTLPSPPLILVGDPSRSTGRPYNTFYIQLSNGTHASAENKTFVIYDSKCIQCISTSAVCQVKSSTCKINGYCFAEGESNPMHSSARCVPLVSQHNFTTTNGSWSNWGAFDACSETCQSNVIEAPTQLRRRTCNGGRFDGTCAGSSVDTRNCNIAVTCPGSLTQWSEYGPCSATCQSGLIAPTQQRTRTCMGVTFGGNCNGASLTETGNCNVGVTCLVSCPVRKRCNCSLTLQFPTTAPALGYFNIDDARIHAAINTLTYWTKEIQHQICDACNLQRLQASVTMVNSHVTQVKAMINRLNEIKKQLRDIINCNKNVLIGSQLWALYDYLYTRCTMLNGVYIELVACKMKFEAANNSCQKYGWFHDVIKYVYSKW